MKYTFRKLINDIHLWLGLASGIILFLVCLSGTILTFEEELKNVFTEKMAITPSSNGKLPIEKLKQQLETEGTVRRLSIPYKDNEPYEFSVATSPEDRRGTTFFSNPYTGEYRKKEGSSIDGFMMFMFRMHRWLLLDPEIGRPIVGISTIIFLLLSISGLVLWFPKKMKWKQFKPGFKIKFKANWKRINHDLHNTLGFYACIFLLIMSLTGLCWSFDWYRDAGSSLLGTQIFGNRDQKGEVSPSDLSNAESMPIEDILTITSKELNYEGETTLSFPKEVGGPLTITKKNQSSLTPDARDKMIIDAQGTILSKELFGDKPFNEQIATSIRPIHTGQIFGKTSKIVYLLACLIATSLPITGTLIWWHKLQKKRKRKKTLRLAIQS